jgi:hypothetical protein
MLDAVFCSLSHSLLPFPWRSLLFGSGTAQYEDWRYIRPWQRVARGDTEDRVVALLGRPHRIIMEHSDKGSWESENKIEWFDAESVKDFRYVPLSITGEEYEVSFDSSGCVVSKLHITSP